MQSALAGLGRSIATGARGLRTSSIARAGGHDHSDPHAGKVKLGPFWVKTEHYVLGILAGWGGGAIFSVVVFVSLTFL